MANSDPAAYDYADAIAKARAEFLASCPAKDEQQEQPEQPTLDEDVPPFRLFKRQDIMNLPDLIWKVQDAAPDTGVICIYGEPATAKSFLAQDMACAVAEGRKWFGLRTNKSDGTIIVAEGQHGIKGRILAWEAENKRELPENVQFLLDDFYIGADVERLAKSIPTGTLIVIDTLNRVSAGLDENSNIDMGIILANCKKLQKLTSGLVCLVHHCGKNAANGLRGHSSLLGALDVAIEVSRRGNNRVWKVVKNKDGKDGQAYKFTLNIRVVGKDAYGDDVTSCSVFASEELAGQEERPLTDNQRYALESLQAALEKEGGDSIHVDAWRPHFYGRHCGDNDKTKATAFRRGRNELVNLGVISVTGYNYSIIKEGDRRQTGDIGATCRQAKASALGDTTRHPPLGGVSVSSCGLGARV
ncbi:MAG: AAA family ATPase [Desulfovibrio desulfuricans]|nr:AAA family ATPase [Desulfovibrio desulfuricans]